MNFPNICNPIKRRALGRRWGLSSAAAWRPQDADADTARKRFLWDRKGQVVKEGITYHGDGYETTWQVRHSVDGRTDQFDIVGNGRVYKTGGIRMLPRDFRPILVDTVPQGG